MFFKCGSSIIKNMWRRLNVALLQASSPGCPFMRLSCTIISSLTQKQPPEVFRGKSCSWKFRNVRRKTPVLESLLNKVIDLQAYNFIKKRLQHKCFPVSIGKYFRTAILKNINERLLLLICIRSIALTLE